MSLMKILHAAHNAAREAESRWFDRVRRIHTSGNVTLQQAGLQPETQADSHRYVPARAANIRSAIRAVPAGDLSRYTFVDLGAGKGRGLFVAAEFSFCRIVGVEVSALLHQIATRNVASFRYRGHDANRIVTLAQDATTFEFPEGPLVLYMFNPFGPVTMQSVLNSLERSINAKPRHVVVILLWPVLGHLVLRIPGMRLIHANRCYEIYEAEAADENSVVAA